MKNRKSWACVPRRPGYAAARRHLLLSISVGFTTTHLPTLTHLLTPLTTLSLCLLHSLLLFFSFFFGRMQAPRVRPSDGLRRHGAQPCLCGGSPGSSGGQEKTCDRDVRAGGQPGLVGGAQGKKFTPPERLFGTQSRYSALTLLLDTYTIQYCTCLLYCVVLPNCCTQVAESNVTAVPCCAEMVPSGRSRRADELRQAGFTQCVPSQGGLNQWLYDGLP